MDVEEYSVIGARSSTEELSHSGLYKSLTRFKIYTMFDREPVQCCQKRANVVILPCSSKNSSCCILVEVLVKYLCTSRGY